ncbi:CDP-alcohol phosphatidyltransferase-like enzyme [Micromonospora sp. Llam0]|uniref:DUF5941 domain-containing protein n=1 Tax=Micromonospora sp. Llam0 TaxID=2485143 RepID=UPI000FAAA489|nr:DUF5941 domain-containing protein [Micromonospora sp. Llam0]ROO52087.1 CDP-alcohol phosphatidyltransferase-like enzyme [Micromonospora sp. Llam0]
MAACADEARTAELATVADIVERAVGPVLLCATDVVAHTEVIRLLSVAPAGTTRALLLPAADGSAGGRVAAVSALRGRIVAVTTDPATADPTPATADPTTTEPLPRFGGVLRVGVGDLPALATAARAAATRRLPPGTHPLDAILAEFVADGAAVGAYPLRHLVARRVADPAGLSDAEARIRAVDPDRARLRLVVKEQDDLFATYFVSSWSPIVAKVAARIGLSPTGVTAISVAFAAAAALLFAVGDRPLLVLGAVLLYLGFVLDCVDGQLARYTGRFSAFGGWLDTIADRGKEYLVYAGLGVGVHQAGPADGWAADGWVLATAAIVLQTVRHMTDAWYGALHDEAAHRPSSRPATGASAVGVGGRLSQASDRVLAAPRSPIYWAKRTIVFPIGERWALIAVTVVLFGPLVSLWAVLGWGLLAAIWTAGLRTLRARSMRVPVLAAVDTANYRDDGFLAGRIANLLTGRSAAGQLPLAVAAAGTAATLLALTATGMLSGAGAGAGAGAVLVGAAALLAAGAASAARPATGALDWLVPAALRAAELLFVVAAGVVAGVPAAVTYGLLLILALHHYDLTARLEKRLDGPPLRRWSLGWDGRTLLLAAAAAGPMLLAPGLPATVTPVAVTTGVVAALAGYLMLHFLVTAVLDHRPSAPDRAADHRPPGAVARIPAPRRPPAMPVGPAPSLHPAGRPAGTIAGDDR